MGSASLRINYRPVRIGLCVPHGDFEAFADAIRLCTTLWGGRFNPILPVGEGRLARSLVQAFRPDYLFAVRQTDDITKFVDAFPELGGSRWHGNIYEKHQSEVFTRLLPASAGLAAIYDTHVRGQAKPEFVPTLVSWSADDPLAHVFLCQFGAYPQNDAVGYEYEQKLKAYFKAKSKRINRDSHAPNPYEIYSPLELGTYDLEEDFSERFQSYGGAGVFVGDATSFDDVCLYWNLLAAGRAATFFDPSLSARCLQACQDFAKSVVDALQDRESFGKEATLWTPNYTSTLEVPDLGVPVGRAAASNEAHQTFNPAPARMVFPEQAVFGSVDDGTFPILRFPLPEKPWPKSARKPSNDALLAVDVDGYVHAPGHVYFPPNVPTLNRRQDLSRDVCFSSDLRTKREGVSFITNHWSTDGLLAPLTVDSLVQRIFRLAEIEANPSNAGRVGTRLIAQMGGVHGCRVFKLAGVRKLISKFPPDKSFSHHDAMKAIGTDWKKDYGRLNSQWQGSQMEIQNEVFKYLLRKEVFRAGLVFKCDNCLLEAWHSLDDSKLSVPCPYCGDIFSVATQLRKDSWKYRRSGLFGRNDDQEGAIPVSLVLQQLDATLRSGSRDAFGFTCGYDLKNVQGLPAGCETDFVYLARSRDRELEVAIGECKSSGGTIGEDATKSLGAVADLLCQKGVGTYVVFAKTGDWTAPEVSRCLSLNQQFFPRVIILGPRELEPYFMYSRASLEYPDIRDYVSSLAEMASITLGTYGKALKDGTLPSDALPGSG